MTNLADWLNWIDWVIVGAGTILIMGWAARLSRCRSWQTALHVSACPTPDFSGADLLVAVAMVFLMPSLVMSGIAIVGGRPTDDALAPAGVDLGMRTLTATIAQSITVVGLIALGRSRATGGAHGWGLTMSRLPRTLACAILAYILCCPPCALLLHGARWALEVTGHPAPQHQSIQTLLDATTPAWIRVLTILNAMTLAPVVEELLFRGFLQTMLMRQMRRPWTAILISGSAFGLIHLPYTDTILPLALFGVILGFLYARTGSLTLAILTHVVFNTKTLLWLVLGAQS